MPTRPSPPRLGALSLAALLGLSACGDAGPSRQPVSGTITLDGKPLAAGTVVFAPLDGLTAATAEVRDGAYRIDRSAGPAPGRYQVEVRAEVPTGKQVLNPDAPSETMAEFRSIVPPRYNARTELAVEVKPDADNAFPFELKSAKTSAPRRSRRR